MLVRQYKGWRLEACETHFEGYEQSVFAKSEQSFNNRTKMEAMSCNILPSAIPYKSIIPSTMTLLRGRRCQSSGRGSGGTGASAGAG